KQHDEATFIDDMTKQLQITTANPESLQSWIRKDIDIILDTTGNHELEQFILNQDHSSIYIRKQLLEMLLPFVHGWSEQISNLELILNNIRDGLIVVNTEAKVQLINKAAKKLIGINDNDVFGVHIKEIVKNTQLPKVLKHLNKEVNQKLTLENGKEIITTRIPLLNENNHLIGAFAIFKDSNEVITLAEENTDLK